MNESINCFTGCLWFDCGYEVARPMMIPLMPSIINHKDSTSVATLTFDESTSLIAEDTASKAVVGIMKSRYERMVSAGR